MKNRARRVLISLKPFKICLPSIHALKKKGKKVLKLQKGKKEKEKDKALIFLMPLNVLTRTTRCAVSMACLVVESNIMRNICLVVYNFRAGK